MSSSSAPRRHLSDSRLGSPKPPCEPCPLRSPVPEPAPVDNLIALDEFSDTVVEADRGLEPCPFNPGVAYEIVSLVRVLADLGRHEVKLPDVLPNRLAQFPLAEVGV